MTVILTKNLGVDFYLILKDNLEGIDRADLKKITRHLLQAVNNYEN